MVAKDGKGCCVPIHEMGVGVATVLLVTGTRLTAGGVSRVGGVGGNDGVCGGGLNIGGVNSSGCEGMESLLRSHPCRGRECGGGYQRDHCWR